MKRGREDAADEPEATIGGEQSAAVAAAAVAAAESAVAATAGGAATAVPPPAAIPAVELPVGEHVHEKVGEDLDEETARLHERIEEEFYGEGHCGRDRVRDGCGSQEGQRLRRGCHRRAVGGTTLVF